MRTVYVADDGKQFDDYEDCEQYENGLKYADMGRDIVGWDDDWVEIPYTDREFCDDAIYLKVKTEDAAIALKRRFDEEGAPGYGINGAGLYLWNFGEDFPDLDSSKWYLVSEIIDHYQGKIDLCNRFFEETRNS